jgi:hypothetical protein
MNDAPSGSFERAVQSYDPEHRERVVAAIMSAIARASLLDDAKVMALRTGETTDALISVPAWVIAMRGDLQSPAKVREAAEHIRKVLIREVPMFRGDLEFRKFMGGLSNVQLEVGSA